MMHPPPPFKRLLCKYVYDNIQECQEFHYQSGIKKNKSTSFLLSRLIVVNLPAPQSSGLESRIQPIQYKLYPPIRPVVLIVPRQNISPFCRLVVPCQVFLVHHKTLVRNRQLVSVRRSRDQTTCSTLYSALFLVLSKINKVRIFSNSLNYYLLCKREIRCKFRAC